MRIIRADDRDVLEIARVGEQEATQVRFSTAWWYETFGAGGSFALEVERPGDDAPYLVPLTVEPSAVVWTVSATDAAILGRGRAQLRYLLGGTIAKTMIWTTRILASLSEPGEPPPEPWESYVDAVHADAVAAEVSRAAAVIAQDKAEEAQADAKSSKLAAAAAQSAAEAARDLSAQWATGSTAGTPGPTNNAAYYAQRAAAAAASAMAANRVIADAFDASTAYAPGDLCLHDNHLFVFVSAHAGAWDAADVEETTVDELLTAAHALALGAYPTETVSGPVASTEIGADGLPLRRAEASVTAIYAAAPDPDAPVSPTNQRSISGWSGCTVTHYGDDPEDSTTYSFNWQTEAGTVYGGTLDVLTGILTVTHWGHAFNGEEPLDLSASELSVSWSISNAYKAKTLSEEWTQTKRLPYSSHYRVAGTGNYTRVSLSTSGGSAIFSYVDGYNVPINLSTFKTYLADQAAAETPVTLAWVLDTPKAYQLDPVAIKSLLGSNALSASTGDMTATYRCDPTLALDQIRNAILSLGNNT